MFNFLYALMVRDMDRKQREEFDSVLNSGVASSSWAKQEAQAWDLLTSGEIGTNGGEG